MKKLILLFVLCLLFLLGCVNYKNIPGKEIVAVKVSNIRAFGHTNNVDFLITDKKTVSSLVNVASSFTNASAVDCSSYFVLDLEFLNKKGNSLMGLLLYPENYLVVFLKNISDNSFRYTYNKKIHKLVFLILQNKFTTSQLFLIKDYYLKSGINIAPDNGQNSESDPLLNVARNVVKKKDVSLKRILNTQVLGTDVRGLFVLNKKGALQESCNIIAILNGNKYKLLDGKSDVELFLAKLNPFNNILYPEDVKRLVYIYAEMIGESVLDSSSNINDIETSFDITRPGTSWIADVTFKTSRFYIRNRIRVAKNQFSVKPLRRIPIR